MGVNVINVIIGMAQLFYLLVFAYCSYFANSWNFHCLFVERH